MSKFTYQKKIVLDVSMNLTRQRTTVLHLIASWKLKVEPHKYLCGFRGSCVCVNGPSVWAQSSVGELHRDPPSALPPPISLSVGMLSGATRTAVSPRRLKKREHEELALGILYPPKVRGPLSN